jgi:hypothetical protein
MEKRIRSPPEKYSQNDGSTCIRTVEALRRSVKRRSEIIRDTIIM